MRSHALDPARANDGLIVLDKEYGARARPVSTHPGMAHLVIGDHTVAPPEARVRAWVDELVAAGFAQVRTGALAQAPSRVFVGAGFAVEQRLVLLRVDPRRRLDDRSADTTDEPDYRFRTARSATDLRTIERIDAAAFGPEWCIDSVGVLDACDATPSHRMRMVGDEGYAVTGRSGSSGFVQRLAVDPSAQGQGIGRRLMVDSLTWLRRWRVTTALVNTHLDNVAALSLYASLGFTRLDQELVVMRRALGATLQTDQVGA